MGAPRKPSRRAVAQGTFTRKVSARERPRPASAPARLLRAAGRGCCGVQPTLTLLRRTTPERRRPKGGRTTGPGRKCRPESGRRELKEPPRRGAPARQAVRSPPLNWLAQGYAENGATALSLPNSSDSDAISGVAGHTARLFWRQPIGAGRLRRLAGCATVRPCTARRRRQRFQ